MNSILSLTPRDLRKAANIQERIASLQKDLSRLLGGSATASVSVSPKRRKMSAAGRARIAAAARARWAKLKRNKSGKPARTGRRKMSAAAKARLAAVARARWAKAKAAGRSAL